MKDCRTSLLDAAAIYLEVICLMAKRVSVQLKEKSQLEQEMRLVVPVLTALHGSSHGKFQNVFEEVAHHLLY